ncbi:MAG: hypothetical protein CSA45_00495 [Gammaproteobacteria bacterium]|nr:MAG: hypothetical protein CSA45_00495 [Gammaproteobacteria bacterium]
MPTHKKSRVRRVLWLGTLYILITVLILGFASLTLISSPSAISDKSANGTSNYYSGYIEGDYRFIAAPSSGWLTTMPWQTGDYLSAEVLAFTMEDELQALAVDKAQAQVDAAIGQLTDLQSGKRDAVLDKLKAQREVLKTTLTQATIDAKRNKKLAVQKAISRFETQHTQTQVEELKKQIEAIDADIALARLPARDGQLKRGQAQLAAARAALAQAKALQTRRKVYSRIDGEVSAVYRYAGEWVQTGQAVIKVLPKGARKVIFYVPEKEVGRWQINDKVMVSADGVPPRIATIREIDNAASFTPPVIYSEDTRAKLVFRMVAYFDDARESLPVGLPVSVSDV